MTWIKRLFRMFAEMKIRKSFGVQLANTAGNAVPLAISIALSIVIIAGSIFEYMRLTIIASGVRDAVQASIISVSANNYDKLYNCLREGYSGGYELSYFGWQSKVDIGDVYTQVDNTLGLRREGKYHVKYAGSVAEFRLSELSVAVVNTPFAPAYGNASGTFLANAKVALEVPLSFGWEALPAMKINLGVEAGYTPKF